MTSNHSPVQGWKTTVCRSITEVSAAEWDICVGIDEPLVRHSHLKALEQSGIAAPENGFSPCHIIMRDASGQLVAAAPAYLKTHSKGELGVDLGLAFAHGRAVGAYYPKLQVEVPMMPFGGRRLLVHPDVEQRAAMMALLSCLKKIAADVGASSVQIGYMTELEANFAREAGYATTETNTFAWRPADETCFKGFLARMNAPARSELRRHRRRVAEAGLRFRYFRGAAVTRDKAVSFFELYKENFDRHKTPMWLNQNYFLQVFDTMKDYVELCVSGVGERWVGAVFSIVAPNKAYTQYWGQADNIRFLHFEQVMYRGMERAYVIGLDFLDFGPTGAHKAERGLKAEPVYHAAWFRDQSFAEVAVAGFQQKTKAALADRAAEHARLPFLNS